MDSSPPPGKLGFPLEGASQEKGLRKFLAPGVGEMWSREWPVRQGQNVTVSGNWHPTGRALP